MRIFLAIFLLAIIIVSGCTTAKTVNKTSDETRAIVDSLCKATGEVKAYSVDIEAPLLQQADAMLALNSKCSLFASCDIQVDKEKRVFVLYALNADNQTEKKIFGNVSFSAFVGIEGQNGATGDIFIFFRDKKYSITNPNGNGVDVDGRHVSIGQYIPLNGVSVKYYDFKGSLPIFQVFAFEGKDIAAVVEDTELTKVYRDPNGFGIYSILIQIKNEAASRLREYVKNSPSFISIGPNGQQASLRSRIYYYGEEGNLLASANLPAEIQTNPAIRELTILGIEQDPVSAVRQFELLRNGLKLYAYPEIKVLNTEKYDCRDF